MAVEAVAQMPPPAAPLPPRPADNPQVARAGMQQAGQIAAAVLMGSRLPPPGGMAGLVPRSGMFPAGDPMMQPPPAQPAQPQQPGLPLDQQRQAVEQRRAQQQAEADQAGDEPLDRDQPLPRGGGAPALFELPRLDNSATNVNAVLLGAGNSSLWPGADGILDSAPE